MWLEVINLTIFLDELTKYFGILQYAMIHTNSLVYVKRDSQESGTGRLKDNTINARFLEFPKEHMSSALRELYKIGDISLSVVWTDPQSPTYLLFHFLWHSVKFQ